MPVGAIVGAGVVGAGASIAGASKQASATKDASNTQAAMYDQTRSDLLPYNTAGQKALKTLQNRLTELTTPVTMDQATLEQTPGYQFNLSQGLKSTQNSAAARGLGNSGAALKGAASYATGLADSTYQQQYNNAVTNQTNTYNRLMGLVQTGQNAASQTGNYGTQTAASIGANTIAGGTATAAGYTGAANALSSGVNNYMTYNALKGMYG